MILRACRIRCVLAVLPLFFWCFLTPRLLAEDSAAGAFKFTKIDTQVLDEANELDRQYARKGLILDDPSLQAYLDGVGNRVLGARQVPGQVQFRFRVLRDPMVNAFALPNGSVYVTTGLLALLENEAELAGVLGHEVGHVFDRHTYLFNRSERKKILAVNIMEGISAVTPVGPGFGAGVQVFGAAAQLAAVISSQILVATIFGYSRDMERQADRDGLDSMAAASYDPHAMARSFQLLDNDEKLEFEPGEGFYHDHPKLTERRQAALEFAASQHVAGGLMGSEKEYLDKVSPAICYNIEADLDSRRARTALARATRLAAMFPGDPKYQVLEADAYRSLGAKSVAPTDEELSQHGQGQDRKAYFKMTEQEEQKMLLRKPDGPANLQKNLEQSEKLYQGVIEHTPTYAPAYRDLGFLYDQEGKYAAAAAQYRRYLDLAAGASIDRLRIERRLAAAEKLAAPGQPPPQ